MKYNYSYSIPDHQLRSNSFFRIELEADEARTPDLILPDCTPGLMFIEEGCFTRKHKMEDARFTAGEIYLFGQKTQAASYTFAPGLFSAYGYKLNPAGIYAHFGIAAEELTDGYLKIDHHLLPEEFKEFKKENNTRKRDGIVPETLEKLLSAIHTNKGMVHIQQLTEDQGIGYKRAERLFKLYIGMTPKLYSRIVRFNYCVKLFGHPLYNLTDIAYQSGYFDQNHFIKEAKKFTGHVPSELLSHKNIRLEQQQIAYLDRRGF